jgi:hypothetical protein
MKPKKIFVKPEVRDGGRWFECAADENTTQPSAAEKQPLFAAALTIEQPYEN